MELLARAHERAPDDARIMGTYALALARVYGMESFGQEVADRARVLATKAAELDPTQGEPKVALAIVHLQNQEADAAVRYLRGALAVAPNSLEALDWLARVMGEAGRVEEAFALWRQASAIDPDSQQARQQIARVRSILGDRAGMLEALGALPSHPGDIATWFITQIRDVWWKRDVEGAKRLAAHVQSVPLPDAARQAIEQMLTVPLGRTDLLLNRVYVDRVLPVGEARSARRASFNAQMRAELFAYVGMKAETLEALHAGNGNGLFDIVWLDRCPLFDPFRADPEFVTLRGRIALRAERIASALGAHASSGY
jgi:serine/threonine-protein kinase